MAQLVVLDLGLKSCLFETHQRHCVVSLSKTLYPLLGTGSAQEGKKTSRQDQNIVDWDVNTNKTYKFGTNQIGK